MKNKQWKCRKSVETPRYILFKYSQVRRIMNFSETRLFGKHNTRLAQYKGKLLHESLKLIGMIWEMLDGCKFRLLLFIKFTEIIVLFLILLFRLNTKSS